MGSQVQTRRMILSDLPDDTVAERIDMTGPDLVLAIGTDALSRVKNMMDVPVVYVMVLDSAAAFSGQGHITGVNMIVKPEKQLAIILDALPGSQRIGLVYDPEQSGRIAAEIRAAAARKGVELRARPVFWAENVSSAVMVMKPEIDVFWMLPDLTVVTPETVNFLILWTMESGRPIVTFADKYAKQGALMSIGVDPYGMGRQAGKMAEKILAGTDPGAIPCEDAEKADIAINMKVAEKLGISVDEKIAKQARIIE
ncbi:MAG: hypothetical protein K9K81_11850 [Desulfobacteraceae bacterium]|nr:hypothetical protein [Desulfobacteraceae bacterium]